MDQPTQTISVLRHRMIEDMRMRKLSQKDHSTGIPVPQAVVPAGRISAVADLRKQPAERPAQTSIRISRRS
jgi:hypothetical protein